MSVAKTWNDKEFKKVLKNNGYEIKRQGKGDHTLYTNGINTFVVSGNVNKMVARRMIKTYGLVV